MTTVVVNLSTDEKIQIRKGHDYFVVGDNLPYEDVERMFHSSSDLFTLPQWCGSCYGNKQRTFIDVGCNLGLYTVTLAKQFKKVHAFDPIAKNMRFLSASLVLNDIWNCFLHDVALGDEFGNKNIHMCGPFYAKSSFLETTSQPSYGTHSVTIKPLDAIDNLGHVGFIKISVEGYEWNVLEGARNTILTNNYPPILISSQDPQQEKVFALLNDIGYKNIHPIAGHENTFIATT